MGARRAVRRIDGLSAAGDLFSCLRDARDEYAGVAYLGGDRRLLAVRFIRGGRDWVSIAPRTLTIDALAFRAEAVVMAHNHPSGDPEPSRHDLDHVRRVSRALSAVDVRLLDHLVIAGEAVTSLRAMGVV